MSGKIPEWHVTFFTVFKLFLGSSIMSRTLQRYTTERPMEFLHLKSLKSVNSFKREKSVAKIDFRGQILILVLLAHIGGKKKSQKQQSIFIIATL